ncbi:HEAT repeat domain-containing protein [Brevibacillus dissolubilis]|uniref:HEAT repeat domain-containing protein n=1 Tax=Brevibacillus dissolubilis TaxID=1844116 RepID=UPI0011163A5F|nr:HEAT repeat domain-containing protein [Brevibacillus dissolubilis]
MTLFAQYVLLYLLVLLAMFLVLFSLVVIKKWQNQWRERSWRDRKEYFLSRLQQHVISPGRYSPRMKGALRGGFRQWALQQMILHEHRLRGQTSVQLDELLVEWGFDQEVSLYLKHRRWWNRLEGLHVVGTFQMEAYREQVARLLYDPHPLVRQKAFWAYSSMSTEADLATLTEVLAKESVEWYQLERIVRALELVKITDDEQALTVIQTLYQGITKPLVRRALLEFMALKGMYGAITFMVEQLEDTEAEVRIGAVKGLTQLYAYPMLPRLIQLIESPTETAGVKIMAMKSIATLGDKKLQPVYEDYLSHPIWWVRYYSAVGIVRIPYEGEGELRRLASEHPDAYGREMARYFLQLLQEGGLWKSIERSLAI